MSTRNDVFSRTIGSLALATLLITVTGCHSTKVAETPAGPNFHLMTYNVNWGEPRPELAAALIRKSGADIVCLQETTPAWEQFLRQNLASDYSFIEFRHSTTRMGGGLAFLAKVPAREVAYIPSETGWFDGWIMRFETAAGIRSLLADVALEFRHHQPASAHGSYSLFAGVALLRRARVAGRRLRPFPRRSRVQPRREQT
jgi:hypothetical protein